MYNNKKHNKKEIETARNRSDKETETENKRRKDGQKTVCLNITSCILVIELLQDTEDPSRGPKLLCELITQTYKHKLKIEDPQNTTAWVSSANA